MQYASERGIGSDYTELVYHVRMSSLSHKYRPGDTVGVVGDCMADCEIVRRIRQKPGTRLTYVAKAVKIHHPRPEESFFGKNPQFLLEERQILVSLRKAAK